MNKRNIQVNICLPYTLHINDPRTSLVPPKVIIHTAKSLLMASTNLSSISENEIIAIAKAGVEVIASRTLWT